VSCRTKYPEQFRRHAIELVNSSDRRLRQIARELGAITRLYGRGNVAKQPETDEASRLRKQVAELQKEKEILRKAAAYFCTRDGSMSYRYRFISEHRTFDVPVVPGPPAELAGLPRVGRRRDGPGHAGDDWSGRGLAIAEADLAAFDKALGEVLKLPVYWQAPGAAGGCGGLVRAAVRLRRRVRLPHRTLPDQRPGRRVPACPGVRRPPGPPAWPPDQDRRVSRSPPLSPRVGETTRGRPQAKAARTARHERPAPRHGSHRLEAGHFAHSG
jgi:transposase